MEDERPTDEEPRDDRCRVCGVSVMEGPPGGLGMQAVKLDGMWEHVSRSTCAAFLNSFRAERDRLASLNALLGR